MQRSLPVAVLALACAASPTSPANEAPRFDCLIEPNAVVALSTRETGTIESFVLLGDTVDSAQQRGMLESRVEKVRRAIAAARA